MSTLPPVGPGSIHAEPFGSDHRGFTHAVQFYLEDDFLIRLLSRMIRSACRTGDAAIVVATQAHHHALANLLLHEDLAGDTEKHAYFAVNANEMLALSSVDGILDMSRLSERCAGLISDSAGPSGEAQRRVFVYGELVALLCAQGKFADALALEQAWDEIGRKWMMSLLCGYPIRLFDKPGFEKFFLHVCAAHPTVSPPDGYPSYECEKRIAYAAVHSSWLLDSSQRTRPN